MCFSAPASFVAGVGLLGIGAATLKRVRSRSELLYAMIPLLFGVQQLLEGMLWLTISNHDSMLTTQLTYLYLFLSNVLWAIYIPLAVLALETVTWRFRVAIGFACVGAAVSTYLLAILFLQPVTASVNVHHILYDFPNPYEQITITLYVIATCASLLFSSHRRVAAFGIVAFVSAVTAHVFYTMWFISVWCFFAAVLSIIVLWNFTDRRLKSPTA